MNKSTLQICYGMSAAGSLRQAGYDYIIMFTHDFDGPLQDFKAYEEYENRSHFLQEERAEKFGTYGQYGQMFFLFDKSNPAFLDANAEQQIPLTANGFINIIKEQDEICFWLSKGFHEHILLSLFIRLFDLYGVDPQKIHIKTVTESHDRYGIPYAVYRIGYVPASTLKTVQTASPLTVSQISYFRDTWFALTSPTPDLLIKLSHLPNEFHFLEGLREFIDRLPDSKNALNACEREILKALYKFDQNITKTGRVMGDVMGRDWYYPQNDGYIYTCIKRLSDQQAKTPALIISPLAENIENEIYLQNITLTDFGKALIAGEANWLDENEIDYHVGGIHVSSAPDGRLYFSDEILKQFPDSKPQA